MLDPPMPEAPAENLALQEMALQLVMEDEGADQYRKSHYKRDPEAWRSEGDNDVMPKAVKIEF